MEEGIPLPSAGVLLSSLCLGLHGSQWLSSASYPEHTVLKLIADGDHLATVLVMQTPSAPVLILPCWRAGP